MNKYELCMIVDAGLPSDEKETTLKEATDAITKNGGKIINSQVWLEKQKMAFLMGKKTHGTYYTINFEGPAGTVAKLRPALKLNDRILRFLPVKAES